ncbi:MAG: fasciclin domain-containing protein [Dysgonamonadaceae bacterium]|jgi:uncharacterized surface protein with fasciclin (FAS1) repeats|nr:fasciclin domain-containing protein [Dysgonamonadaceae bacterium]
MILIFCLACTDDTYDRHYQADTNLVAENNLMETVESLPELSLWTEILRKYGYDRMLSQTQAYTLFAPSNRALAGLDTTGINVQTELIENHIARYILPASGNTPFPIAMLNGKRISLSPINGNWAFGSTPFALPNKSIVASNGIVHLLDNYETFFPNTWEYLAKNPQLDSIKNYLYSFDEIRFEPEASVPGSVVDGQQTYLDSVFVNYNTLVRQLGYINREDSSYTMIVPTNEAWTEAYNRIKEYYVYYNKNAATADSLQRANTAFALLQDLVFNNTEQISPQDSLISTSGNTFYHPQYLFEGAEPVTTSNGTAYMTDLLRFKPHESWHDSITVEAEFIQGRENTLSTPSVERVVNTAITGISNGRYLKLDPTTTSGNPTASFEIPNTLSGKYNIYCVFVTGKAANEKAQGLKPNKVFFNLTYLDTNGKSVLSRFPASGNITTDPNVIDTVTVASGFKFPTANYGETDESGEAITTVILKIVSDVGRTETTAFSRVLLLDCILLEPEKQ